MKGYNRVVLAGNITRDIELKYTQGGTAVTNVGLAVNEKRKSQAGEWIDEVVFVDVTFWGRTAEVASEYLGKGSPVLIEGRLRLDTWETDGQKRSQLRVVCEKMNMLGGRGESGSRGGRTEFDESEFTQPAGAEDQVAAPSAPGSPGGTGEKDIPF